MDKDRIVIEGVKDFHPDHIFDNGQCFRWEKEGDGSYTGIAYGKVINVNYIDQSLIIENSSHDDYNKIWKAYFDLDRDYGTIKKILSESDEVMVKAIEYGHGLRILNQEKWETLISFIISQNNNIPRIKKCIEKICEAYGEPADIYKGKLYYTFPKPEVIANLNVEDLAPVRLGYRAKYIIDTARQVTANGFEYLDRIGESTVDVAFKQLLTLSGIGPKVANCILLFSMGKYESFPVDVWVRRVMSQLYFLDEKDTKSMHEFAKKRFGEYGGIAQQYLFYYIREQNR